MAMGVADLVPGVSGGTIAFISGIYEELIGSLGSFRFSLLKDLKTKGIKDVWTKINGNFLLTVSGGVSISLITLSNIVAWLMDEKPIALWSFFFGLVLASIVIVIRKIDGWQVSTLIGLGVGTLVAYSLTHGSLGTGTEGLLYLFLSGALAICAMILPGISGAFILILLGSYYTILEALNSKDIIRILVFLSGAVVGILSFSKVIKWLLNSYNNLTLAILTGFMTGALAKIWPWRTVLSYRLNSKGVQVPLLEEGILPTAYTGDPKISTAIGLMILGFMLIFILDKLGPKSKSSA